MIAKRTRKQELCQGCEAYDFPHRLLSGDCYGHNLADCPNQKTITDPYGTGDLNYHWIQHSCYEAAIKEQKLRGRNTHVYA